MQVSLTSKKFSRKSSSYSSSSTSVKTSYWVFQLHRWKPSV
jgi:coagulation factor II (thrombin) receptor-like 1